MTGNKVDPFCPLYREAIESAAWKNSASAHAGLLFDKFADAWWHDRDWKYAFDKGDRNKSERDKAEHEKEGHWLKRVFPSRYAKSPSNLTELLTEACSRQRALVEKLGGKILCLTNTDRFVTGMGREHPLENGFAWHHTLGVPYLPGSSLKGVLRAWLREELGELGKDRDGNEIWVETDEIKSEFGEMGQAGRLILFDMLPTAPPHLDIDVMTPHYGPYYQDKSDDNIPGDWHSPVPISFLTVAAGQSWQLGIAPASGTRSLDATTFESLVAALQKALETAGAGAKTAVGYGRLVDPVSVSPLESEAPKKRKQSEFGKGDKVEIVATGRTTKPKGNRPGKPIFMIQGSEIEGFFQEGQDPPSLSEGESIKVWIANTGQFFTFTRSEPRKKQRKGKR